MNCMFNKILTSESVPESWGRLMNCMLLKNTLVNNIVKAFTKFICDRLVAWATELNIIPESQSRFKKGRICLDNLFFLNSIIQLHLSKPGTMVFAIFVDFKGAFPSVSHQLLWQMLHKLGLSIRVIKIIKSFYDAAYACIRTLDGQSDFVKVSKGVLQGKILSPYLFLLFIYYLELFLIGDRCRGLAINSRNDILILGYVDDYVLLSNFPLEVSKKLNSLSEYCNENSLIINADKTKIVIFTSSAKSKAKRFKFFE